MGISSVFSLFALFGFLLLIGGVALIVLSSSQGRPPRGGFLMASIGLVIGLVFSVISQSVVIVQPNEIAVVFNTLTGKLEEPRRAGTNLVLPVVQQAVIYPIDQQEYTMSGISGEGALTGDDAVRARTTDGQEVQMDVTILYSINSEGENVNIIHQRWQNRYEDDFIRPTTRGFIRDVVSQFRADEIYGLQRTEMEDSIQSALANRMAEEGLLMSDLLVRDINFSQQFTEAIERAQIAEQDANQARLRVQQIQQEAEQARAQAEGARDAEIARAEGSAQSIVLRARAEAEGLRLVSEQIAANPALIQYQYVQNLSDNVSLVLVPSTSPFLFDFQSLADLPAGNAGFSAPEVPESDANLIQANPRATPTPSATPTGGN